MLNSASLVLLLTLLVGDLGDLLPLKLFLATHLVHLHVEHLIRSLSFGLHDLHLLSVVSYLGQDISHLVREAVQVASETETSWLIEHRSGVLHSARTDGLRHLVADCAHVRSLSHGMVHVDVVQGFLLLVYSGRGHSFHGREVDVVELLR